MRVLLDNGTPRGVAVALDGHTFEEARARGWDQQNLAGRQFAIVVLGNGRWTLIKTRLADIAQAVATAAPGSLAEIDIPVS